MQPKVVTLVGAKRFRSQAQRKGLRVVLGETEELRLGAFAMVFLNWRVRYNYSCSWYISIDSGSQYAINSNGAHMQDRERQSQEVKVLNTLLIYKHGCSRPLSYFFFFLVF